MSLPLPSKPDKKKYPVESAKLTDDEVNVILDNTLDDKYREDPHTLAFIEAFVRCKHIGQASEEAGIAPSLGYKIRHRKSVALAIQKLNDRAVIKYGFDGAEIMERTKEIVDFDPIMVQNADGTFKSNFHDMSPEARRNIKKLKAKNIYSQVEDINGIKTKIIVGEVIEYEFYDKMKAIDMAGKEKDMFKTTTKVEHTVSKDMASLLLESAKRGDRAMEKPEVVEIVEGRRSDEV